MSGVTDISPLSSRLVVLLCHERSGSTLFCDLLDSRGDVAIAGDVWNFRAHDDSMPRSFHGYRMRRAVARPESLKPVADEIFATLDGFFAELLAQFDAPRVVVDIKYGHLASVGGFWYSPGYGSVFLQYLKNRSIPLIHLFRRDVLAAVASGHLAMERGVWNIRDTSNIKKTSLHLNPHELSLQLADLSHNIHVWHHFCKLLGGTNVAYEDLVEALPAANQFFHAIEDQIGLAPSFQYKSELKKISPDPEEYIDNFNEINALSKPYRDMKIE